MVKNEVPILNIQLLYAQARGHRYIKLFFFTLNYIYY